MISHRCIAFAMVASLCVMSSARAQNLLGNSTFDSSIDPWPSSQYVNWSPLQDHDEDTSASGGSMQISTETSTNTFQCVSVKQNATYIRDLWVGLDPNSDFAPCATPTWQPVLTFFSGPQCTEDIVGGALVQQITPTTSWTNFHDIRKTPAGANSANFQLDVGCVEHNGAAIVYFDDISLTPDSIFADDLDFQPLS